MTRKGPAFKNGEWLVHCHYGIGQIMGVESKTISGEASQYYKFQTMDSTVWIPVDQSDSDRLRPVSSHDEMREALAALRRPPQKMEASFYQRKGRIDRVTTCNEPLAMARMIRDLRARRHVRTTLSGTEDQALRLLTRRLVQELAVTHGIDTESATQMINGLLRQERAHEAAQPGGASGPASVDLTQTALARQVERGNKG